MLVNNKRQTNKKSLAHMRGALLFYCYLLISGRAVNGLKIEILPFLY